MRKNPFYTCFLLFLLLMLMCLFSANAESLDSCLGIQWNCPVCGRNNNDRFCPSCGYEVHFWICGSCCSANSDSFCPKCGWHKLTSQDQIFGTWIENDHLNDLTGGMFICFQDKDYRINYVEAYTPTYVYFDGSDQAGCGTFEIIDDYACIVCLDRQSLSVEVYDISVSPDGNTIAVVFPDAIHMLTRSKNDNISFTIPSNMVGFSFRSKESKLASVCPYGSIIIDNNRFLSLMIYQDHSLRISRLVGLPGETIMIRDNVLFINQEPCDTLNMFYDDDNCDDFGPVVVPDNCYFVLNDNRMDISDSRSFGCVDRKYIVGSIIQYYNAADYASAEDFSYAAGQFFLDNSFVPVNSYATDSTINFTFTSGPVTSAHTTLDISKVEGYERSYLVPSILTEDRYNLITSKMKKATKKKLSSNYTLCTPDKLDKVKDLAFLVLQYPIILEQPVYLLKSDTSDINMVKIESYFSEAGYTEDDFAIDMPSGNLINKHGRDSYHLLMPDAKVICLKPDILHSVLYCAKDIKAAFSNDSDDTNDIISQYGISNYNERVEDGHIIIEYDMEFALE